MLLLLLSGFSQHKRLHGDDILKWLYIYIYFFINLSIVVPVIEVITHSYSSF